ncbi:MAG: carboxypeptidase regulatory-like domain-containing protein [Pyrinomonadaceae bacterium]|nr:carboxypeptidase regulatory-like domain-containing protein [Pyrinomonadaceae bacterium]
MKRILLIFLVLVSLFSISVLGQQETGQISGNVSDINGAAVPNATVTIKSTTTGFSKTTTTGNDGYFIFVNVQPGKYEVNVKANGFEEYKTTRELAVAGTVAIDANLVVTGQKAVVDVVGTSISEINTSDQTVSGTVTSKQLTELPTITRNPYGFVSTLPNVSEGDPSGRGVGVAINGQRAASTSVLINGGENVDTFTANTGQNVPLYSVQEFKVMQSSFTADFGRATGGVVNLVTRTGTNEFHGSGYVFNRNSRLATAGFDANAQGTGREFFNRNQFGFEVGGPIVKEKLLFFNNTEWLRIRSNANKQAWIPTAASIAAANANTRNFFSGYTLAATPIVGQTTTLAGTGANALTFQKVSYTVPSDTGAGSPVDSLLTASRIDWNASSKFNLFGVLSTENATNAAGSVGDSPYAGFSTGQTNKNINLTVAGTYNYSSNLIGVSRFTFNRLENQQPLGDQPVGPTLYLKASGNSISGTPIAFPGYLPFSPGSAIPFGGPQYMYTASQEMTWIKGDHIVKGGFQYYYIRDNRTFGAYQNSVQQFDAGSNTTAAVDRFFAGTLGQFQGAINPNGKIPGQTITLPVTAPSFTRDNRYQEFSFYGMDSFKLFPGFTANVGMRYEYYGPQRNVDRSLDFNFYFGSGNSLQERIRNGTVQNAQSSPVGDLWKADKNNWAPSVGFAYDIEGNGKSSLRAGYALRYERNFGNVTFNVIQNPTVYGVVSILPSDVGGTINVTKSNAGPLSGSSGTITLPRVSLRAVNPNTVNAYAHQWSASYERQIGRETSVSAAYSGSTGKKLYTIENINRSGSGTLFLGSTVGCPGLSTTNRLNCTYSNINARENNGYSNYNGVTFSLRSGNLFNQGLSLASYYTYSRSADNLSSTFSESGNNFNLGLIDPFNPSVDYGNSDFDIRHRFVNSFIYTLPFDKHLDGVAKTLAGGWQISGIYKMQSGAPFTVYDCLNGITICTRVLIPGNYSNFKTGAGVAQAAANSFNVLNLTGLSSIDLSGAPYNCTNGCENGPFPSNMSARNAFRGPGSWNLDLAVSKTFAFTERYKLVLRGDANNIFNHANMAIYGGETDIFSTNFINAGKFGRRQIQIGARLMF